MDSSLPKIDIYQPRTVKDSPYTPGPVKHIRYTGAPLNRPKPTTKARVDGTVLYDGLDYEKITPPIAQK